MNAKDLLNLDMASLTQLLLQFWRWWTDELMSMLPPEWRGVALGAGTAAGSFGQFVFAPFGVAMLDNFGWQAALMVFAGLMLLVVPLSLALATPAASPGTVAVTQQQTFKDALAEAFGHRSYILLVLGFFIACFLPRSCGCCCTSALKRGMYMPNASWRRRG